MGLIEVAIGIFLLITVLNLYKRLNTLERRLEVTFKEIATRLPPEGSAVTAPMQSATPGAQQPVVPQQSAPSFASAPSSPPAEDVFVAWLKENWLLKLGALLILLAFGWLVTYAFMNNWIGPAGRITLGLAGGALILSLGFWRMREYVTQGAIFVILGATTILLTTYAARTLYDFFTPFSALALMFATSFLVSLASGVYNRRPLGVAGIVMAGVAPLLTHSPSPDQVGLFLYLIVVTAAAVWIVVWKNFREVVMAAFIVVALYTVPILLHISKGDMGTLLLFGYAFAAIFYLTNTVGLLRLKGDDAIPDLMTAAGNALLLLAWIYVAAAKEWQSLIIDAWAIAFVLGAFAIYRISRNTAPLYLYSAIGVAYIAASTALVLHGSALTIAYTIESGAVALILYVLTRDVTAGARASFLLLGPAALTLPSIFSREWTTSVVNEHFFVLAVFSATCFLLAMVFWKDSDAHKTDDTTAARVFQISAGSAAAYILLWLSLHAAFVGAEDTATTIALFVYTIIGVAAYAAGMTRGHNGLRIYGGILLGFVVGRLLIVDVWQMALSGRIITFFLVGALLMSTAFLAREKKIAAPTSPPAPPSA
jgi:uncharacterized membrane protein